jgi:predicted esterase YcpF (UPF0227 family)
MAAAVGSLMTRSTFNPAIVPARKLQGRRLKNKQAAEKEAYSLEASISSEETRV